MILRNFMLVSLGSLATMVYAPPTTKKYRFQGLSQTDDKQTSSKSSSPRPTHELAPVPATSPLETIVVDNEGSPRSPNPFEPQGLVVGNPHTDLGPRMNRAKACCCCISVSAVAAATACIIIGISRHQSPREFFG